MLALRAEKVVRSISLFFETGEGVPLLAGEYYNLITGTLTESLLPIHDKTILAKELSTFEFYLAPGVNKKYDTIPSGEKLFDRLSLGDITAIEIIYADNSFSTLLLDSALDIRTTLQEDGSLKVGTHKP
jgi:hypothetical protein